MRKKKKKTGTKGILRNSEYFFFKLENKKFVKTLLLKEK